MPWSRRSGAVLLRACVRSEERWQGLHRISSRSSRALYSGQPAAARLSLPGSVIGKSGSDRGAALCMCVRDVAYLLV